jgi:HK97 family phage portal protein
MNRVQKFIARVLGLKASINGTYTISQGRLVGIPDNQENYIKQGYNVNDIIYSAVNVQLDKVRLAPWSVYKIEDESSLKKCYGLQSKNQMSARDRKEFADLWLKALTPVKNPGKWGDLLKYANEDEAFPDFVARGCGYKLLTGNKYVWADVLEGGANKGIPNSLHVMPSQHVQIKGTDDFPGRITAYELYSLGLKRKGTFQIEEVLHEKYSSYDYSVSGEQYYGQSPLRAALRRINRSNSAIDAATAKFKNGGLDTVLWVDGPPDMSTEVRDEQARAVKHALINEYTGPLNQGKIAASGWKIGATPLGLSPVDLAIIESEKWDQVMIASVFGVPPELIGHTGTKTYDNIKTAEKALTSRCALPLLTSFRNALNNKAAKEWGLPKGYVIDFDMTVFSELQEDVSEMMKWVEPLVKMGMPVNRALELLNLEQIDDKIFDEPWIRTEMGTPLSEWKMNDVDNALDDDNP